ncbi:MAG TPA: 4Fe-4S double cluster binding domain-containing protein [Terriglobia bacterium]|nr:4Fe-4S double cluster binding domain-containing protein [Terriglobia bacterium]
MESSEADPTLTDYKYRTVSVEHLGKMKAMYEKLSREGRLSQNKTYLGYLRDFQFEPPPGLPNARSLVIAATPWRLHSVNFRLDGRVYVILIPGGYFYYINDPFIAALKQRIAHDVIGDAGAKLVLGNPPLKATAVRSGLAEYGRNNVAYVEEYGSFHVLWAFFAERELPDQWNRPFRMMRFCKGCSICLRACTTRAITESNFMINATRCVTLYNEMKDPIPDFIDSKVHNALIGCLKCQATCPANLELARNVEPCADLTEEETKLLVSGQHDPKLEAAISAKFKELGSFYAEDLAYLSRNLKLALANAAVPEALA